MALTDHSATPASLFAGLVARLRAILTERSDQRMAQLAAGQVFLVRVANAMLTLLSQVLLARWMGAFEFGVYVYAWTMVLMIGCLSDMGLASAARRFIPEYTSLNAPDKLRGFLSGSRWLAFAISTVIGATGVTVIYFAKPWIDSFAVVPLYLACAIVPIYGLVQMQAGIAQSYDWPNLALMPFYIIRTTVVMLAMGAIWLIGAATDAITAMLVSVIAVYAVTIGQGFVLERRLKDKVPAGARAYDIKIWLSTSLPIFVVEGFYLLLTYVDILAIEHFRSPEDVAVYYAGARLLAIVAFVYFAIASSTAHKFTEYHVAGDKEKLAAFFAQTIRWTFWPSLAVCAGILLLGKPLLYLFGPNFQAAYPVMFILAVGMMSRAAVGPAERLLNMLGDQKKCAAIYAGAFAINLVLCVVLIPRIGIEGAGVATSSALIIESILLYYVARKRLGLPLFMSGKARA